MHAWYSQEVGLTEALGQKLPAGQGMMRSGVGQKNPALCQPIIFRISYDRQYHILDEIQVARQDTALTTIGVLCICPCTCFSLRVACSIGDIPAVDYNITLDTMDTTQAVFQTVDQTSRKLIPLRGKRLRGKEV